MWTRAQAGPEQKVTTKILILEGSNIAEKLHDCDNEVGKQMFFSDANAAETRHNLILRKAVHVPFV